MPISRREVAEAQVLVHELERAGWTRRQLAKAIGFTPANLSQLVNTGKRISPERLHLLKLVKQRGLAPGSVLAEVLQPPEPEEEVPEVYVSEARAAEIARLVDLLRDGGFSLKELAAAFGCSSGRGLSMAIRKGRIPIDVYTRAMEFGESDTVKSRVRASGALPVALPLKPVKKPSTARDVAGLTVEQLRVARDTLETALDRKVFRSILEPGIQRVARSIQTLENQLEELLI